MQRPINHVARDCDACRRLGGAFVGGWWSHLPFGEAGKMWTCIRTRGYGSCFTHLALAFQLGSTCLHFTDHTCIMPAAENNFGSWPAACGSSPYTRGRKPFTSTHVSRHFADRLPHYRLTCSQLRRHCTHCWTYTCRRLHHLRDCITFGHHKPVPMQPIGRLLFKDH
jgi:hypothetical protein